MDDKKQQPYTPEQQRTLEFMAAYLQIGTTELERRIVAEQLNELEDVFDYYAFGEKTAAKPKGKLSRVVDFSLGGDKEK